MREIKFRGKNKNKRWAYGHLAEKDYINEPNVLGYTLVNPDTVGQYTGLKDKNGVEIYDGDIIKAVFADEEEPEMKGVVIYVEAGACYMVIANNGDEWDLGYLVDIEVMGNKHDNPEILEGD